MRWLKRLNLWFSSVKWGPSELFWRVENRPKTIYIYIVIKWSWLNPQPRFRVWIFRLICKGFLRKSRESSAKAVAKEKVSMEASSPHSTFAAASQGNVVNNEPLLFPGGIFPTRPCIYPWLSPGSLTQLPFACCLSASQQQSTAQKWIAAVPWKINARFAKDSRK